MALLLLIITNPALAHSLGIESDSGINGPQYSVIINNLKHFAAKYPEITEVIDYGKSVEGETLTLIKIGNKSKTKSETVRKAVLITGATHGDEYLGIEDRLPEWFLTQPQAQPHLNEFLARGGVLYIAPIFNPDGYRADDRGNSRGKDLNRDFPLIPENIKGFTQPETAAIGNFLNKELDQTNIKLVLSMDYHCCIGALIHPWSYKDDRIPAKDYERHQMLAKKAASFFPVKYEYGSTSEVLGYYANGTSKDYYYAKYGATSYTFEGMYGVENKRFNYHASMWEMFFADLNSKKED